MLPDKFKHINPDDLNPKNTVSRTWRLDHLRKRVMPDYVDERDALAQAIWINLSIERKGWDIHTDGYGQDFAKLYGKDRTWAKAMVEPYIREALKWDRRIYGLSDFKIEEEGKTKLLVEFHVSSCYGDFIQKVVIHV